MNCEIATKCSNIIKEYFVEYELITTSELSDKFNNFVTLNRYRNRFEGILTRHLIIKTFVK